MIVNPQEFNYRVTIGVLVVVIAVFTAYGLTSYSTLKSDKDFLVQEKRNLHNELSEILNRFDALNSENLILKSQLDSTIYKVGVTSNAIEKLEVKAAFNSKLQKQLTFLKEQKRSLEEREDSLIRVSQKIEEEKQEVIQELTFEKENALREKQALKTKIDKASYISANSFTAKAFKVKNSNEAIQTFKAKDTEQIELSFVIAQNTIAPKGTKYLYVQIIDPDNNVVADKGAISFGDESLIYSHKESVDYSNSALDLHLTIQNDKAFKTGNYYINVFENNRKLGGTQIKLE
ncbi:MAG: hypothetical protein KDC81_06640 [Flavobacteriaceae bacterium]|nr:hypothetical protein [Flavobacteriaceae bacterium]